MAKTKNSKQSSDVDIDAILESTSTAKESNGGSQWPFLFFVSILSSAALFTIYVSPIVGVDFKTHLAQIVITIAISGVILSTAYGTIAKRHFSHQYSARDFVAKTSGSESRSEQEATYLALLRKSAEMHSFFASNIVFHVTSLLLSFYFLPSLATSDINTVSLSVIVASLVVFSISKMQSK